MPTLTDMTLGFEGEVRNGGPAVARNLYRLGLAEHDTLHRYHCRCSSCSPSRHSSFLFSPQEDGTVSGEMVSSILDYGSERMYRALAGWQAACLSARATFSGSTGCHVHVGMQDFTLQQRWNLVLLFSEIQDDLAVLARGARPDVRGYNAPIDGGRRQRWGTEAPLDYWAWPQRGQYLAVSDGSPTAEFRLWNGSGMAWRVHMHLGVTAAVALAAWHGETGEFSGGSLLRAVGDYLDAETLGFVLAQHNYQGV